MEFRDITDEEYREYEWPDGYIFRVIGDGLAVSASGGHRIKGRDGISYYVPPGWRVLRWQVFPGKEMFAF